MRLKNPKKSRSTEELNLPATLAHGTGRRKTSIARAYVREGSGGIQVNGKSLEDYFTAPGLADIVKKPIEVTETVGNYDMAINVKGGGISGQAGACMLGIARALVLLDESNRPVLRRNGLLRRDSRMVERKKFGQRGARRKFQFSKR